MAKRQIGGSFAPPLSDELLDKYQALISQSQGAIKDALTTLLTCCRKWWELPESVGGGNAHPSGRGFVVELDHTIKESLWDLIPWPHEIKAMESLLNTLDPVGQKDLRNAAFHLLWHVKELDLDREPITTDKLV
mgnify:CR=1 FL=1